MSPFFKKFFMAIAIAAVLFALFSHIFSAYGHGYNLKLDGKKIQVSWSELNVREEPGGKVLYQLYYGDTVTLTGKTYEMLDGPYPSWVQISDGNWVVRDGFSGNWLR